MRKFVTTLLLLSILCAFFYLPSYANTNTIKGGEFCDRQITNNKFALFEHVEQVTKGAIAPYVNDDKSNITKWRFSVDLLIGVFSFIILSFLITNEIKNNPPTFK